MLAHADACRARRAELAGAELAIEQATARLSEARAVLASGSAALHKSRAAAGPKLAAAVRRRLDELAMKGAAFEIELTEREPGPTGSDTVEFLIAPNPGVPAGPLRETASGGELSRVMLALMGVAAAGAGGGRRSSSTRSTPASAARRRARSAISCAISPPSAR